MKNSALNPAKQTLTPLTKELEYFIVCAELKSVSKSAHQLDIQQAGLSKIIIRLEEQLGQKLFFRSQRGLELTEYGSGLHKSLLQTKAYWKEKLFQNMTETQGPSGLLKIGCHPSIAVDTFHNFYPKLIENFPSLQIESEFDTSLEITRKVSQLQLDIGLVINPVKNAEIVVKPIHQEFVSIWGSTKSNSKVLFYNPEMFMSPKFLKKLSDYKLVPIKNYDVIASLVTNTNSLGVLPNPIAERCRLHQIGENILTVQLALIWHKDKFDQKARHQIVTTILNSLK